MGKTNSKPGDRKLYSPPDQNLQVGLEAKQLSIERWDFAVLGDVMNPPKKEITRLLQQLSSGNQDVVSQLVPLLYDELRQLASRYLRRERGSHTLQATALVHEAYMRLVDQNVVQWKNRNHFFGVAAQLMRRILVDYARTQQAAKRGGNVSKVSLEDAAIVSNENVTDVLALDETLGRLAAIDQQQARIVELRVFAGLTIEEIAEVVGVSSATVKRDWNTAKAWLARELRKSERARAALRDT